MASKIGVSYAVFAPVTTYTEGSAITYGQGLQMGGLIAANINWNHASADQYHDNVLGESTNVLTGGTIALEMTDIAMADRVKILGLISAAASTDTVYHYTDGEPPIGGFGCISELVNQGVRSYRAKWLHRCQFVLSADDNQTRGESVDFRSMNLDGKILGAVIDTNGNKFMEECEFTTETAAKAWLKSKANIT